MEQGVRITLRRVGGVEGATYSILGVNEGIVYGDDLDVIVLNTDVNISMWLFMSWTVF